MQKPVLVIKLGSAVITTDEGTIDQSIIKKLSKESDLLNLKQLNL